MSHPTRPPPGAPPTAPPTTIAQRGVPDAEQRLWAFGAHLSSLLLGPVLPLVIWSMKRHEAPFVAYHAVQAVWLYVVYGALLLVSCGAASALLPVVWILAVYSALKAKEGDWSGYPLIGHFGLDGNLFG